MTWKPQTIEDVIGKLVPIPGAGCWLWPFATNTKGYGMTSIANRHGYVHRFVYEAERGPIPDGLQILHSCDTPSCANPAHLSVGTAKDNATDRHARHRARRIDGERHHFARLSEAQARSILVDTAKPAVIAARLGVTEQHVRNIKCGRRWSHLVKEMK